jgi:hypothetical protein
VRQQRNMRRWLTGWRPSSLLVESAGIQWSLIALGKTAGSTTQRAINRSERSLSAAQNARTQTEPMISK